MIPGLSGGGGDTAASSASNTATFGGQGLSEGVVGLIAIGLIILVIGILAFSNRRN